MLYNSYQTNSKVSMERNNMMSNSLKDQYCVGSKNQVIQTNKAKDWWNCKNNKSYGEEDNNYLAGFSWPPRSYTCSFCKREFKSAQALGGHMNVHRRDRARLRQSSPPRDNDFGKYPLINLNTYPSSNPNVSSSSSSSPKRVPLSTTTTTVPTSMVYSPLSCTSPCFADIPFGTSSPKRTDSVRMNNAAKPPSGYGDFGSCPGNKCMFLKKTDTTVRLDLEIGMFKGYQEDLDLELRLGYS